MFRSDLDARLILIYVTDSELTQYFRNAKNALNKFFDLNVDESMKIDEEFITSKSETFQKAISGQLNVTVKSLFKTDLARGHNIRIYEIMKNCY